MNQKLARKKAKAAVRAVPILVRAEGATEVAVTGDFTDWSAEGIRLSHGTNGDWAGTLELAPGEYQYRILVDGQWRDHAEAEKRVANPFGSENAVLTIT